MNNETSGWGGFEKLPQAIAAAELSRSSGGTAMGPSMTTNSAPTNNAPTETTPKKRGRPKGPLSEAEKAKRAATRAANKAAKGGTKKVAKAKKESEPVAKEKGKGKGKKADKGEKGGKMAKRSKSDKIIKHGGSLVADIATVGTAALVGARLDDMIDARPFGQDPSTLLLVAEIVVTVGAVYKRKRKIAHYAALATAGTAAGKLARASKKTPTA